MTILHILINTFEIVFFQYGHEPELQLVDGW